MVTETPRIFSSETRVMELNIHHLRPNEKELRRRHLCGFRWRSQPARPCSRRIQGFLKVLPIISGCHQLDIVPEEDRDSVQDAWRSHSHRRQIQIDQSQRGTSEYVVADDERLVPNSTPFVLYSRHCHEPDRCFHALLYLILNPTPNYHLNSPWML